MKTLVPAHERGAALLAVLLLVAIMGAIAAGAFEKLRLSTALASNASSLDQARAYAVGIEDLLTLRVDDLRAATPDVTTLEGGWSGAVRRIELPGGGEARAALGDGGNCFNLNSLADGADPKALIARPAGAAQFLGLMNALGIPGAQARHIADSASDWLDSDHEPAGSGAEDSDYAALDPPYRPADTLFAEVSELRAVAGMDEEIYARLRPFLCALPTTEMSQINVNTLLPNQAPLVAMLVPGAIGLDQARRVIAARPAGGWKSQVDFWAVRGLNGLSPPGEALNQVQLKTSWFALDLSIDLNGAELRETALIDARLGLARVAVRRWGVDE